MVRSQGRWHRGAEQRNLTAQTLSDQISQLEEKLGVDLFRRAGRRLELTDAGQLALSYANEIFQIGNEFEETLRSRHGERPFLFRVGIADVVPKSIAYRLLAPALDLPEFVHMVCKEDKFEQLLGELAIHRLDMVITERPMPPGIDVKGYSHRSLRRWRQVRHLSHARRALLRLQVGRLTLAGKRGARRCKVACSYAYAMRISAASLKAAPTNDSPTGKPLV